MVQKNKRWWVRNIFYLCSHNVVLFKPLLWVDMLISHCFLQKTHKHIHSLTRCTLHIKSLPSNRCNACNQENNVIRLVLGWDWYRGVTVDNSQRKNKCSSEQSVFLCSKLRLWCSPKSFWTIYKHVQKQCSLHLTLNLMAIQIFTCFSLQQLSFVLYSYFLVIIITYF